MTSLATKQTQKAQTELERLTAENKELRRQLRHTQRLATVGTMTAMIVHEFNNILTPIINYAQLAADGDPEMMRKAVAKAGDGGQRASDICSALLGLLRAEASELSHANLSDLVGESLTAMGRDLSKDGIKLTLNVSEAIQVTTRPAELKQVLVNLILNARSAVQKRGRGGSITIVAARKARAIHLSVADSGTGIDPQHMSRLFEPFFTTKTGQDGQEKGNGLGLAICKEIITDMGGEIRVASEPRQGATFTLILPA